MPSRRRSRASSSEARTALLEAAEQLMVREGYAAVTSRKVAAEAGVNVGLVYYYFESMDDLLVALFRRGADLSLQRQAEVLASPQPLWGLWQLTKQQTSTPLTMEFIALASHRGAMRKEIADYARRFRLMQLDTMERVLPAYGLDADELPAESIILGMWAIAQYLLIEQAFGLDIGHQRTVSLIERHIAALEGPLGRPKPSGSHKLAHTLTVGGTRSRPTHGDDETRRGSDDR